MRSPDANCRSPRAVSIVESLPSAPASRIFTRAIWFSSRTSALVWVRMIRLWPGLACCSSFQRSIRAVRGMQQVGPDADFLTPYMQPLRMAAGEVLFRLGEPADKVYVLRSGRLRIAEFDRTIAEGELFGEVGVFREAASRTGTAVCETDCELMWVPAAKLLELFYQDQRFAFLIARRLSRYA